MTHEDEGRLAEWIRRATVEDLLRTLERRSWQDWDPAVGYRSRRFRLRPEIRDAIRRRAAELIHGQGGSYRDRGCVIRSDGTRIWTELG